VDPLLIIGPDRLCFSCHDDSEFTQGPVQHPSSATGQCLTCHAVHESEELKLLKKKHGDAEPCFECHQDLL
jgi:predicted CXXCH cytochrome family protein